MLDFTKLKEKQAQLQKESSNRGGGNSKFIVLEEGLNYWRILPPWAGSKSGMYFRDSAYHKIGPKDTGYICYAAEGKSCPVCSLRDQLKAYNNTALGDVISGLKSKPKVYFNVIDRKHPELGVQVGCLYGAMAVEGVHGTILSFVLDPKWGDLTDPDKGRDITIEKKGSGLDVIYEVRPDPTPTPVDPDPKRQAQILSQLVDLDVLIKLANEDVIAGELAGTIEVSEKLLISSGVNTNAPIKESETAKKPDPVKPVVAKPQTAAPQISAPTPQPPVQKSVATPAPAPTPVPPVVDKPAPSAKTVLKFHSETSADGKTVIKCGGITIPEKYHPCFSRGHDGTKDACQMCQFEEMCSTLVAQLNS